jgi:hypothetical protein
VITRRALIAGGLAAAVAVAGGARRAGAAKPTVTVYKPPT